MAGNANEEVREYLDALPIGTTFELRDIKNLVALYGTHAEAQARNELERNRDLLGRVLFGSMGKPRKVCPIGIWRACGGTGQPSVSRYVRLAEGDPRSKWLLSKSPLDALVDANGRLNTIDVIKALSIKGRADADKFERARAIIRADGRFVRDPSAADDISRYTMMGQLNPSDARAEVKYEADRAISNYMRAHRIALQLGHPDFIEYMRDTIQNA